MLELRPYQAAAVNAVYNHLRSRDDNPCVVCPTGAGKSLIIAQIARDSVIQWQGRVLVLAHVQELLEQNADKIRKVCAEVPVGIYSAGLRRRDMHTSVVCAGIQSIYKRACDFDPFDLIVVDEAHLIPAEGDGMYRQFLVDAKRVNPTVRVIGLTATPYRLKSGLICGPENILNAVCYEIGVKELIRDGYLSPLVTKAGTRKADTSGLHVRGGEFVANEVESLMDQDELVRGACAEIVEYTKDRTACLLFASGINHGQHVVRVLKEAHGIECGFVSGETPAGEREELLARFRCAADDELFPTTPLKYLCNVNVLTTGFDAPHIDGVVLLRPTMSPGLYYQMTGRGLRLHPGKANCLVLDFGGNIVRHGPIDQIKIATKAGEGTGEAPAKECPECHSVVAAGFARCPDCGFLFPPPERQQHDAQASEAGILSGQVTTARYVVRDIFYTVHVKKGADLDAPRTMRVDYRVGLDDFKSEWVCFEHDGYARRKAIVWWKRRSPDLIPDTAEDAVALAEAGALATTNAITVRTIAGDPFERIIDWELGPMPESLSVTKAETLESVPF